MEQYNSNNYFNFVLKNPDKPWEYCQLSRNPNVTWETVQSHPEKPRGFDWLSDNPNITWETVLAHLEKPWNYDYLSANHIPLQKKLFEEKMEEIVSKLKINFLKKSTVQIPNMSKMWLKRDLKKCTL